MLVSLDGHGIVVRVEDMEWMKAGRGRVWLGGEEKEGLS